MRIRVLSWNIHKGIGGLDRRYRFDRIAELIRCAAPDIALLQEVADRWPAAGRDLQAELLSQQLPLHHFAFSPEHRFSEGGYGNAVLSRFPILDSLRIDLKIGWRKQRSALQVCLKLPAECSHAKLFATSLHLGLAEAERRKQLIRLFEADTQHSPIAPSILGGDFNDVFGTLEGRFMGSRGYRRLCPRQRSFPASVPFFSLDAIFGHQVLPVATVSARLPHDTTASDHRPLIAEFEVE